MSSGATPLFVAAQNGHAEVVAKLLAAPGVDPNEAMDGGVTPLIVACHANRPAVAGLLLHHGADPLAIDGDGDTALKCAQRHPGFPPELLARLAGASQRHQQTTPPVPDAPHSTPTAAMDSFQDDGAKAPAAEDSLFDFLT